MKLNEISGPEGTYVALRVLPESGRLIRQFCDSNQIPISATDFESRLHVTLIYSRKKHSIQPDSDLVYESTFKDYNIFTSQEGKKVLVVLLTAPSVVARHVKLMADHSATYDYPVYHPHVSLCYDYQENHLDLPPMDFPILLGKEYVEPLNLNWS